MFSSSMTLKCAISEPPKSFESKETSSSKPQLRGATRMTTAVKLSRKTTNKNEGEGTVAKVRESQSAMKTVEEMSTDANASRRSLPVAQIIEKNAEEDLANLFAPMAPKSKKTKAKKKFLSSGLGGKVSLAMKEEEVIRRIAATTSSSSSKKSSAQMQSQTKKSEYQAFVDYYSMEYQEYEQMPDKAFEKLRRNLSLEQKHRPMLTYMVSLGFKEKDLEKLMLQSEEQLFSKPVSKIISRVEYLKSELGLEGTSLVKIVSKDPQILLQRNRHSIPRCRYLTHLGLDTQELASVLSKQPSILHLSVQNSLKPRVDYFRHELGIASEDLAKVITRNPAVLTFSVEDQIAPRVEFLKDLGISHENVAKLILRHPQTLQYSFDGIKEHVNFLAKDCKMNDEEVAKTISRLNTFFSLSLEDNLRPKYEYLIDELGGTKQTAISFPAYWSLALDTRIKPRHRFMEEYNAAPDPFPMKLLAEKDEVFVKRVRGANLDAFEAFKKDNVESYIAETQKKKLLRSKVDHLRGAAEEAQSCVWPNPAMVPPKRVLSERAMRSRDSFRNMRSGTQHRGPR
ncbi:unnamed protein product [Bathycoccus prasinos]|mmetsp:Transcript_7815/g.25808  ORF Transcript_7815/g.25808 Transcript_7815/m.25808 type:complete len:568 (+) Transcript_7815:98-1801(+)